MDRNVVYRSDVRTTEIFVPVSVVIGPLKEAAGIQFIVYWKAFQVSPWDFDRRDPTCLLVYPTIKCEVKEVFVLPHLKYIFVLVTFTVR